MYILVVASATVNELLKLPDFEPNFSDEQFWEYHKTKFVPLENTCYEDIELITSSEFHSMTKFHINININIIGRLRWIHSCRKYFVRNVFKLYTHFCSYSA